MQHAIVTLTGDDGYTLNARYWQAEDARALVLFVHGVVSHGEWLEGLALEMQATGISCLAVDRRGAGLNKTARGDAPSESALLNDLHASITWAAALDLPIHLCGFCWGSNYVVNYLSNFDPTLSSTIYIAPSLFPSEWILQRDFETGNSGDATEEPVMPIDQFTDGPLFESYIKPDPLRLRKVSPRLNHCMQLFSRGIWMKFLRLRHPCLLILGNKDTVVDNNATLRVFERLQANPKHCISLDANHGIQFEQSTAAANAIIDWIGTIQSTRASQSTS